jgi:hypothetical protein
MRVAVRLEIKLIDFGHDEAFINLTLQLSVVLRTYVMAAVRLKVLMIDQSIADVKGVINS